MLVVDRPPTAVTKEPDKKSFWDTSRNTIPVKPKDDKPSTKQCHQIIQRGLGEERICLGTILYFEHLGYAYCQRCRTIYR